MEEKTQLERLEERLVGGGWVEGPEFERMRESFKTYQQARLKNPHWPKLSPVAFVESFRPRLSFLAWAVLRDIPLEKAEDICADAEKTFGRKFFAFKELDRSVPKGRPVGQTLLRMGELSEDQLNRTLELQEDIENEAGVRILLGILLVRHNLIAVGVYFQALALHFGIEAKEISDELLERLEAAWIRRSASP